MSHCGFLEVMWRQTQHTDGSVFHFCLSLMLTFCLPLSLLVPISVSVPPLPLHPGVLLSQD